MNKHEDCKNHSKMMWIMMLPCLLMPFLFLYISGHGTNLIKNENWQWVIPVLLMIVVHGFMMKFMNNHCTEDHGNVKKNKEESGVNKEL